MQVLVHCEDSVCCDEEMLQRVEGVLKGMLDEFSTHLIRVEARLSDLNSASPGDRDKICSLDARLSGAPPVTARYAGTTLTEAIHAAISQLVRSVARECRLLDRKSVSEGLLASNLRAKMH